MDVQSQNSGASRNQVTVDPGQTTIHDAARPGNGTPGREGANRRPAGGFCRGWVTWRRAVWHWTAGIDADSDSDPDAGGRRKAERATGRERSIPIAIATPTPRENGKHRGYHALHLTALRRVATRDGHGGIPNFYHHEGHEEYGGLQNSSVDSSRPGPGSRWTSIAQPIPRFQSSSESTLRVPSCSSWWSLSRVPPHDRPAAAARGASGPPACGIVLTTKDTKSTKGY
jgi:hypothetical protein